MEKTDFQTRREHEKLRDKARAAGLTDEDIRRLEAWTPE